MSRERKRVPNAHPRGVLNVCCPYSSRDEITHAVEDVLSEVTDGDLRASSVVSQTWYRD